MATVLELIYNPTSQLPYQDRMLVPVAAPSIFGAIQQVQQLAAQRAEADAAGRQSLANALRFQQMLNLQRQAQREQLSALQQAAREQALGQLLAQQRQEAYAREMAERELGLREKQLQHAALAAQENDLLRQIQQAKREASGVALANLEHAEKAMDDALATRLSALQNIAQQQNLAVHAEEIPKLFEEIASLTEDRTPLVTLAKTMKAKAEQQRAAYEMMRDAAEKANRVYLEEMVRLAQENESRLAKALGRMQRVPYDPSGSALAMRMRDGKAIVRRAVEAKDPALLYQLLSAAGALDLLSQAQGASMRQLEALPRTVRDYITFSPAGFSVAMPKPLNPDDIEEWLNRAKEVKPQVSRLDPERKYRLAQGAAEKAIKPLTEALRAVQSERERLLRGESQAAGNAVRRIVGPLRAIEK
jgi:hypothetical protein